MLKKYIKGIVMWALLPWKSEKIEMEGKNILNKLNMFSPEPNGTSIGKNDIIFENGEYDLQIVIPAYNVDRYLKHCLDSVIDQKTKYKILIVLVDDGSSDDTLSICEFYLKKYSNIKLIKKENGGAASARNADLKTIQAKYIGFLDSDDLFAPGAIDLMMDTIIKNDADIVEGNFCRLRDGKLYDYHRFNEEKIVTRPRDITGFFGGKIMKSSLFSERIFPEGYWFEDTNSLFTIFPPYKRCIQLVDCVYYYRDNTSSASNSYAKHPKSIDTFWVTKRMIEDHAILGLPVTEEYLGDYLQQIIVNFRRTYYLDDNIQKYIFAAEMYLLNEYFNDDILPDRHCMLYKFIKNGDYGKYRLYCRLN